MDIATLEKVPLFTALPAEELARLAATLPQAVYPAGQILFREGEHGERFYIVLSGSIAIIKALGTADERLLGVRGAGEFVGEMSLLSADGLRTATVRVHEAVRVLELTRAGFDELLHRYPWMAYEMLRVQSQRLGASHTAAMRDLQAKNQRLAQAYTDLQAAQARIIEQETLEHELRLARSMQESMLPAALPRSDWFELGAHMRPARMVGGDFYDVLPLGPGRLGLVIADVCGKGVPAALFMALVSSLLRAEAGHAATPADTLRAVNRHLLSRNSESVFVTLVYGVLERERRELTFARAGHDLPLILRADGAPLELTRQLGHPLGLFPESALDVQTVALPPGSTLLLYTDGISEAADPGNRLFGTPGVLAAMRAARAGSAQQLCDHLLAAATAFQDGAPQADDMTLLAARVA